MVHVYFSERMLINMKKRIAGISIILAVLMLFTLSFSGAVFGGSVPAESKVKVLIAFDRSPGATEHALVKAFGGDIKYSYTLVPAIAASVPEAAIQGLMRNPHVVLVEYDTKIFAIGELDNSWGVKRIGSGTVHSGGNTGAGVKVAVIDSGVDGSHPDLDGNYSGGYDFVNNDTEPMDDNGHGTHVAGTIAAEMNGTGVIGVAPGASIYALKVLGADGSGDFSDVIAALQWCVNNGIKVTNNSYGSSSDPGTIVKDAFDNAYANGIINIGSAGNSGNPPGKGDNVGYPAKYASVVAVAATDQNDKRASFSSTGPDVEVAAPGVGIISTVPGGGYASYSGTSMASPHVAGVAALIIASGITDPGAIRDKLRTTADDLGASGFDTLYGYGIVDAIEATEVTSGVPLINISSPASGQTFSIADSITFEASAYDPDDGDISSAIVWTSDKDGSLGNGDIISFQLSEGEHIVTASVTDSDGNAASAHINLSIVDEAPVVTIIEPANGASFEPETLISFVGTASDKEDGDITSDLIWTSSIDGVIGYGGAFEVALSEGSHVIKAEVNDSKVNLGVMEINIEISTTPTPSGTAKVSSIIYSTEGGRFATAHMIVTVTVTDENGILLSGASVSADLLLDETFYKSLSGITDTSGSVAFKINNAPSGSYSLEINGIYAAGLTWDGITPYNSFTK